MNCGLCSSTNLKAIGRIPDSNGMAICIYQCRQCQALGTVISARNEDRSTGLQVQFHERFWQDNTERDFKSDLENLSGLVRSLKPYIGNPNLSSEILEVGAGRGGLLKALRLSGYNARGCEPAASLVDKARNYYGLDETVLLNLDVDAFFDQLAPDQIFSSVILWHVLEHLEDPIRIMKRLLSIVEPNGKILIQVPLLKSQYIYPEHYFFMSHISFHYLADALSVGLFDIIYDEENMFATAVFCKEASSICHPFLNSFSVPDPLSQIILLTEKSRLAYKNASSTQPSVAPYDSLSYERVSMKSSSELDIIPSDGVQWSCPIEIDTMSNTLHNVDLRVRSKKFSGKLHNRYWWYNLKDCQYLPPVFKLLSEEEWAVMSEWFHDSERRFSSPGEISIPGISFLSGLIGGSGLSRVVQCGHYAGYSSLLLGFLLRGMDKTNALFSVDIDHEVTDYTRDWIEVAGLSKVVKLTVMDSADEAVPNLASEWLGGSPQLVFIDSSHQYEHTLRELDRWYDCVEPGGFIIMHDVSIFAQQFDSTARGGVLPAVQEWASSRNLIALLINRFVDGTKDANSLVYKDGCGLGLIQKPS